MDTGMKEFAEEQTAKWATWKFPRLVFLNSRHRTFIKGAAYSKPSYFLDSRLGILSKLQVQM